MSAALLKHWMESNDKTAVDIASALQISPATVSNYLKGKRVHRSTRAALERLILAPGPQEKARAG